MKQDVTLRGVEIPDGYEPTGEFRDLRNNEAFISDSGLLIPNGYGPMGGPRIILRKARRPAEWMPDCCWLYRYTSDGQWAFTNLKPFCVGPELFSRQGGAAFLTVEDLAKLYGVKAQYIKYPEHVGCVWLGDEKYHD